MRRKATPPSVTTARRSLQEDRRRRVIQYLWAMGFRIVAFPLAVWALMSGWMVTGWILAGIAIVAPSIAVGLANNVDHRTSQDALPLVPRPALNPGGGGAQESGPQTLPGTGTWSDHHEAPGPEARE